MDHTEDLSARILLRHILSTEPPKTPVTRSVSRGGSATRRSSRILSRKDAGAQTPQAILRRSLKHKMRESLTRKSLPAPETRTASVGRRRVPASSSMLLDDGDTPRHVLKNILQTEPVKSPVVHEKGPIEEQGPASASSSTRCSVELSALDLPDVTIGNVMSTVKGLSRKRPRRSLNVSAFEKRLRGGDDAEEESEDSLEDHSSLSSLSSSSLSLKTPFGEAQTEKRGLQRKVANRHRISVEQFGAAVNKRQTRGIGSAVSERDASETAYSEGFTLGLSKLSEPDITKDIVNCSTALYAQPDAMTSTFSIIATQDKATVMASQLQIGLEDRAMDLGKDASGFLLLGEEEGAAVPHSQHGSRLLESIDEAQEDEEQKTGRKSEAADKLPPEEEEGASESQTELDDGAADSQPEEDVEAGSKFEEEEVEPDPQTEEDEEAAESQTDQDGADPEAQEEVQTGSEGDKDLTEPQTDEEAAVDSRSQEDAEIKPQNDHGEEGEAVDQAEEEAPEAQSQEIESQSGEDDDAAESQTEEEAEDQTEEAASVALSQNEAEAASQSEEEMVEPQNEEREECEQLEHISRRSHRSEAGLIAPIRDAGEDAVDTTAAGVSDADSKVHRTFDVHSNLELEEPASGLSHQEIPEPSDSGPNEASENASDANKENSVHQEEASEQPSDKSAPQCVNEQEEEWDDDDDDDDDEENEEFPSKTPAFVREKRNFFDREPSASPSILKNTQARASGSGEDLTVPKAKQVRRRKKGAAERKAVLPKSYLMGVFKHFAKTKVSADVYPFLNDVMDVFFDRMAVDLETYAAHAKRKTIEVEDVVLLLKRQGFVNDKVPVEVLIEKYLRMDQRRLLIPVATSGNVVIPKKRR